MESSRDAVNLRAYGSKTHWLNTKRKQEFYLINYYHNMISSFDEIIISNPFPVLRTYSWYPFMALKLRSRSLDVIHNTSQIPTFFQLKQKYIIYSS